MKWKRYLNLNPSFWFALFLLLILGTSRCQAKFRFPQVGALGDGGNLDVDPASPLAETIADTVFPDIADASEFTSSSLTLRSFFAHWQESLLWIRDHVLLYQPPVGIVAVWTVTRLITSGRLFRWDRRGSRTEQALSQKASRLDRHSGRALDLDMGDVAYQNFGGIERVRRRLLSKALEELQKNIPPIPEEQVTIQLVQSLSDALGVAFVPGGSYSDYVQRFLEPMARVEQNMRLYEQASTKNKETTRLLQMAYQTAEVRVLDGMVRLTRDRLLRTSFRLSRTVQHWQRRVEAQSFMIPLVRQFMVGSMEGDRVRLEFAKAAYQAEVVRLGQVATFLMERPEGMSDSYLQTTVQKTLQLRAAGTRHKDYRRPPKWKRRWHGVRHFKFSNFALRFNADGRGKFSLQRYEDSLTIGGLAAQQVLLNQDDSSWTKETQEWCQRARQELCSYLEETIETSVQATDRQERQLETLVSHWANKDYSINEYHDIQEHWEQIFEMVRDIHQLRRLGDGKSVKWKDANVLHWLRQWDLLGIPSALLHVWLARQVHQRLLPYWPDLKALIIQTYQVTFEIIQTRFLEPVRDLLEELMFRPKTQLLTGIQVNDEETSLDYMLRDLDFGDGTPEDRHEAIVKAQRQYENDLNSGLIWHGGRLMRLLLIQVQQLKVGMLHAADTVDVLLQANRFNIQLLTIIPGIVIVTVGSKMLYRAMFTLRVKNLRTFGSVHGEMTEYLNRLESTVLLADPAGGGKRRGGESVTALDSLSKRELGEFVLNLYDYLVLLDYSSPQPFPSRQCDGIHKSITEFLGRGGSLQRLGLEEQLRLIDQVKRKHENLEKFL